MSPLQVLDNVRLNFSPGSLDIMNVILAFVMFGIALRMNVSDFKDVIQRPKSFIVGIISQVILLPFATFLLCMALRPVLSQSVAMGMILVAACPGGNISNFITTLAKGNISLSVSLSAFSTLTCVIITPFNFSFWGNLYSNASKLVMPIEIDFWEMVRVVLILLGVPIVAGILFARYFPKVTQKLIKPMSFLSIITFVGFVIVALAANFSYFLKYIHLIGLIVILHNAAALLAGNGIGRLTRLPKPDSRSVTIETGIQNSGLGLVLIFNPRLFDGLGGMAFVAAWWGIWHIISGMGLAYFWRWKDKRNELRIKN
ncbi:MAG: bile acid:sodium symporter family protein [Bacteroidales bacterium]|jgi:BASS family bile acid:Na+ symporter|nr:bile acid:sodium symporter family protein [Bacteroidales bacterium]